MASIVPRTLHSSVIGRQLTMESEFQNMRKRITVFITLGGSQSTPASPRSVSKIYWRGAWGKDLPYFLELALP